MFYKMKTKRSNQDNNQNNDAKKENSIIGEHMMKKLFEIVHTKGLRNKYMINCSPFF